MTTVFGLLDPDSDRRDKVLSAVNVRIAGEDGVTIRRWENGALTLLAASGKTAPLDQKQTPATWAWVMGHIYHDNGKSPADGLIERIEAGSSLEVNGLNGYYLACCMDASGGVTLGTDVLGFFPLYYWANGEVLVFSSEPRLIRLHPGCGSRLSLDGLAGILLQGHEANGQSLWQGIRRPEPGHALRWLPGQGASTPSANPLIPGERYFGLDYQTARTLINDTLRKTTLRAVQSAPKGVGLMLSGGMDSRLVAAHLNAIRNENATAFTFGDSSDIEMECATGVARRLRMKIDRVPIRLDSVGNLAAKYIEREHLSNSVWDFTWLTGIATIAGYGLPMLSGFHGDPIMGGSAIPWALDEKRGQYSFDTMFSRINAWGFDQEEIVRMVGVAPMDEVVSDVIQRMRSRYEALPGLPFQKSWLWGLYNRNRYHVVPYAWRLSTAAWPLMPYSDREMLEVAAGMPLDFIAERRMQVDTLRKDFLSLARLPLDRNSLDSSPLFPSRWYRLKSRILKPFSSASRGKGERRAYFRLFDINNAGWRTARELAERSRTDAHRWIKPEALARWVPPPGENIVLKQPIQDSACRKTLLALMILAGQEKETAIG
jgi:asparagine synthase (glutamine-hydrolysing)